jgi:Fe-S oxidoreductase
MVTREEMHSTRGRARLLFEMLQGNPLTDGWNDSHVYDALDLCLACKACKSECPVNVDMATYKAEFLAHYYQSHPRPAAAYTMGWIHRWARLASVAPRVANFFSQTRPFSEWGKQLIGIAPSRRIPQFAARPFRKSWKSRRNRAARGQGRKPVVLWPDTFNNYFHPGVCRSAAAVLERAGFSPVLPKTNLCCGRPLYDFGFLVEAKDRLEEILRVLADDIAQGLPVVVLEPSCASVLRDELLKFFPDRPDARRLSDNTFLLAEFLQKFAPDAPLPKLTRPALVHGHCHQKSIQKMEAEEFLLSRMGLDFEILDSGCCGMAGAFGFEKDHYDVSIAAGERVLLPRVRAAANETLIIADGFSCREQIRQTTGRQALHLAQVLHLL